MTAKSTTKRKAVGAPADAKAQNLKRLARIEGQVRGIAKMVEEDRYCADVMTQISSVQEALRAVSRELMKHHLRHCARHALQSGGDAGEAMLDELLDLVFRNGK